MRLLNIVVIGALVLAAAYVYQIKFEATLQAEQLARLRQEIRRERDAIATLRAAWAKLDTPPRIQELAKRHLALRPIEANQIDDFARLPFRPATPADPVAEALQAQRAPDAATGSIGPVPR